MKHFQRYFCVYCISRLIIETMRDRHLRSRGIRECRHAGAGIAVTIVSLPFIAAALLTALGFSLFK